MPKFKVGDRVMVRHGVSKYGGKEGVVWQLCDHQRSYELDIGGPFDERELVPSPSAALFKAAESVVGAYGRFCHGEDTMNDLGACVTELQKALLGMS